jgi:hypothetical protein
VIPNVKRGVVEMRSAATQVLDSLLRELLQRDPNLETCASKLSRLAFVPAIEAEVRDSVKELSRRLPHEKRLTSQDREALLKFANYCYRLERRGKLSDVQLDDTSGLKAIIAEIQLRYPKETCLCVALGASADLIAVGLRMVGYEVEYIPLSGIEESSDFRMRAMPYLKRQVALWPRRPKILVMDAIANGTSLKVMGSLIRMAYQQNKVDNKVPEITLFALNQPDLHHQNAQELVESGQVQCLAAGSPTQQRIYDQEYKESSIGRLYPKAKGGTAASGDADLAALARMVATLLQDKLT